MVSCVERKDTVTSDADQQPTPQPSIQTPAPTEIQEPQSEDQTKETPPPNPPTANPNAETRAIKFKYVIKKNGTTTETDNTDKYNTFNEKLKNDGETTLLAVTNIKTEWEVELTNENKEPFHSKLILAHVTGAGLNHRKSSTSDSEHTYYMKNNFTVTGETDLYFQVAPIDVCKKKYKETKEKCSNIDTIPDDTKNLIIVPMEVFDIGHPTASEG